MWQGLRHLGDNCPEEVCRGDEQSWSLGTKPSGPACQEVTAWAPLRARDAGRTECKPGKPHTGAVLWPHGAGSPEGAVRRAH